MKKNGASHLSHNAEIEESWRIEDERRMADRAFEKSRRAAFFRSLRDYLGLGRSAFAFDYPRGPRFELALDDIAGIIDARGKFRDGIPPMPRKLIKAWRSAFAELRRGDEGQSRFVFRFVAGRPYLEGGSAALLRLELARARGELRVKGIASGAAVASPVPAAVASPVPQGAAAQACEGIACGIAS